VWRIAQTGAVPLAIGGDGMISLPQMRALHRLYPDLCVLHLDAHTDAYPNDGPGERDRYNPGTTRGRQAPPRPSCRDRHRLRSED
jgi:agmatinase